MGKHGVLLMAIVVLRTSNGLNQAAGKQNRLSEADSKIVEAARKASLSGLDRDAIDALVKMYGEGRESPEAVVVLAKAYSNLGEYEKALPLIEMLRSNPGDSEIAEFLWEWETLHGRTDKAVEMMKAAMKRMIKETADVMEIARIRAAIGETYLSVGNFKDAEAEFLGAIRSIDEEHARLHRLDVPHDHAR